MKVLVLTRLMSGFRESVEQGIWQPSGSPAIYKIIEQFDQQADLSIWFTLKSEETINAPLESQFYLKGLSAPFEIIKGPAQLPSAFGPLSVYLSEFRQAWKLLRYVHKHQPDLIYIDRANILLGAFVARFSKTPVVLRLLGTPPSLVELISRPAISHYLYRWAYRSPFRLVVCTRDGSPGAFWMQRALNATVPKKLWMNGVDPVHVEQSKLNKIQIILIGRLNPLKRIDLAVKAILDLNPELMKKIEVHVIGGGEQFNQIQQMIIDSPYASSFVLHGALTHEKAREQLSQGDILISVNTHGNLTNTVLEACRAGLCLMLPEADFQTGLDVDTYQTLPKEAVVSLRQQSLFPDITSNLNLLLTEPQLITEYQNKVNALIPNFLSWEMRIQKEMALLRPYDLAIVISDLQGGGTQKVLERLLGRWAAQGKRIALITFDFEKNDKIKIPDDVDRIVIDGVSQSSSLFSSVFSNLKRMLKIRQVLKRIQSPVILSFLASTNVLTILAMRGLPGRLIISERNDPAKQSIGAMWDWLRKKYYRLADAITANSESAIKTLQSFVPANQCAYLPNPIVIPEDIEPAKLNKKTILAVGRLHHQKAYDVLIDAFAVFNRAYPEWQLVILGEGDLRKSLAQQIERLNLQSSVSLLGYVDPFPFLAAAQIYVMPSRYEGMPNALLEAMAVGIPTVISDALTGPLNFVRHQEEALVVPVENPEALSAALCELAVDSALAKKLSKQGKQAVQQFAIASVMPQWEALFNE